jgi:uncharacterized protein YecT (DUF1311 family)
VARLLAVVGLLGMALPAGTAMEPCSNVPPGAQHQVCLRSMLLDSDNRLNEVYQQQMLRGDDATRRALREAQRRWLGHRDHTCKVEKGIANREAWLAHVLRDAARTQCVIQETLARIGELESASASTAPESRPALVAEVQLAVEDTAYHVQSQRAHGSRKYYFEVIVEHGNINRNIEADIQLRVSNGRRYVATLYSIRPQERVLRDGAKDTSAEIRLPRLVIGVAADLDAGQFYRHWNGDWRGVPPGSGRGAHIPPGKYYTAAVGSSVALPPLLKEGILSVNFGSKPFAYQPPVGYFAFDDAMPTSERLSLLTSVPALTPGEDIAGEPLSRWIQRYWQWSRSFPKGETPTDDSTGERCTAKQSGPVFFLTGSSKSGTVSRTCVVPKDSYILIPLINVLTQVTPGKLADCEALMRPVKQVNASVTNLYFTLNGIMLQTPVNYRGASGCFELHDVSQDIGGLASGAGYWVVLKPLDVGNHELRLGGTFRADGFTQDIHCRIQVQ